MDKSDDNVTFLNEGEGPEKFADQLIPSYADQSSGSAGNETL